MCVISLGSWVKDRLYIMGAGRRVQSAERWMFAAWARESPELRVMS